MRRLVTILVSLLIVTSVSASMINIILKGQKALRGVGFDLYDGVSFFTNSFFGYNSERISGKGVKIAVIDSGVNLKSPYLYENLNLASIQERDPLDNIRFGIDEHVLDRGFIKENSYPMDTTGYGTFIAGIIKNVASEVKILPVKVHDSVEEAEKVDVDRLIEAIEYSLDRNADVIHLSLRSLDTKEKQNMFWHRAFTKNFFERRDVIFVVSEMNVEKQRVLTRKKNNNLITVCAIDKKGRMLKKSIRSGRQPDVCALGKDVYSLALDGFRIVKRDGEFAAAAFVSSLSALLMQINPDLTPTEIINIIKSSVVKTTELSARSRFGGYLSIDNALGKVLK